MVRSALLLFLFMALPGLVRSEVWQGMPIASQVVGNDSISTGTLHTAALWFNGNRMIIATLSFSGEVTGVGLYCGIAGRNGPQLWHSGYDPLKTVELRGKDLTPVSATPECDVEINNIASLHAAAVKRLIYVEYEHNGELRRGQLWPRATGLSVDRLHAQTEVNASQIPFSQSQQWDSSGMRMYLGFTEGPNEWHEGTRGLSYFYFSNGLRWYHLSGRHEIHLRCAPAGETGPAVINFRPAIRRSYLSNADIIPTDGSGACGITINNVSSFLEAVLQGRHLRRIDEL